MNTFLKSTVGKIVMAVVLVAAVVVVAVLVLTKEESYRTVAIEELQGTIVVSNEKETGINAYEGMHLYSGDDVKVQQSADMTMVLDMDKFVYAEPETHFWLECAGSEGKTQTVIKLEEGSVLNRIKNNLNEGEVYQVDTSNSTMAVRGTVFRITAERGEDGFIYTKLEVFDGSVQVDLKTEDGEYNGVSETFDAGTSVLIRGNQDLSEFVLGEDEFVEQEIEYKDLPQNTAMKLVEFIEDGEELCIGKEILMDYAGLAEHKMERVVVKEATCTEAGAEEVRCTVCNEVTETITLPLKEHTLGDWEIIKEATCEEDGIQQKVCSVCGKVCETKEVKAQGHISGELERISEANCTRVGVERAVCERCGVTVEQKEIAALGHIAGETKLISEADCTHAGEQTVSCTRCGELMERIETAALGHDASNVQETKATCGQAGQRVVHCATCGELLESEETPALEHSYRINSRKDSTCSEGGYEESICNNCGHKERSELAALKHKLGDKPVEIIKPTDIFPEGSTVVSIYAACQPSVEVYQCLVCGKEERREVPAQHNRKISHKRLDNDIVLCIDECESCGELFSEVETTIWMDGNLARCTNCNEQVR